MEFLGFSTDSLVSGVKRVAQESVHRVSHSRRVQGLLRRVGEYGPIAVVAATSYPVGIMCAMSDRLLHFVPHTPMDYIALGVGKFLVYQGSKTMYTLASLGAYSGRFPESRTAEFNDYLWTQLKSRVHRVARRPITGTFGMVCDDVKTLYHVAERVDRHIYGVSVDLPLEYASLGEYALDGVPDRIRRIRYV